MPAIFEDKGEEKLTVEERDPSRRTFHYEGDIPVFETRLSEVERRATAAETRDEQYKKSQQRTNTRLAIFTGLLVLTSLLSGGISIWQARIANSSATAAQSAARTAADTLNELKKSGSDTHALAEDAGKQADAAKAQADATKRLAIIAKSQAETATQMSQTSAKQLELSERAWVGIDGDIVPTGQSLHANQDFVTVDSEYLLRNFGGGAATRVGIVLKLHAHPVLVTSNPNWRDPEYCKEADEKSLDVNQPAIISFPGPGIKRHVLFPNAPAINSGYTWVMGCIAYKDGTSDKIHHTRVLFMAWYGKEITLPYPSAGHYPEIIKFEPVDMDAD